MSIDIHVINLASATDRRLSCIAQLECFGLPYKIFEAIDSSNPLDHFSGVDMRMFRLMTLRDQLNMNEVACYASHKMLWKQCVENGDPIIILEDDFRLLDGFKDIYRSVCQWIDKFDFIRMESLDKTGSSLSIGKKKSFIKRDSQGASFYNLKSVPLCMLAYAISPEAAKKLINASEIYQMPSDKFLQQYQIHKQPIYGIEPTRVVTSDEAEQSTIGDRKKKTWNIFLLLHRMFFKASMDIQKIFFNRKIKL